jgi:hypothetical protein
MKEHWSLPKQGYLNLKACRDRNRIECSSLLFLLLCFSVRVNRMRWFVDASIFLGFSLFFLPFPFIEEVAFDAVRRVLPSYLIRDRPRKPEYPMSPKINCSSLPPGSEP